MMVTVLGYAGSAHSSEEQAIKLLEAGARHTFHQMEQLPGLAENWIKEMAITWPASAAQ